MVLLARAPFLPVLFGLIVLMALESGVSYFALPFIAAASSAGLTLCTFRVEVLEQWRVFLAIVIISLGSALWIVFVLASPVSIPAKVDTTGVIVQVRPWGRTYAAAIKTPQGGFVARLHFATLTEGMTVRVQGIPKPFRRASEKGGFDEELYWRSKGMYAQLSSAKLEPTHEQPWNIYNIRYNIYRAICIQMPYLTGAYLNASWTGQRDLKLDEAHRNWGTSHLLSVSGFHVGVIILVASFIFRAGRWRVPALSLLLWLYVLITGAPASALRAGLMIQVALLGELLGRPSASVNSVSVAAVLLLLNNPFLFWDIGWRLSVLAVLVIGAFLERGSLNDFRLLLALSPMIWIVTFPQATYIFKNAPVVGLLLNLFASPFFSFALSFASLAAFWKFLGLPFADILLNVSEGAFTLWHIVSDAFAVLLPWWIDWSPMLAWCCVGMFLTLMCRAFFVPWPRVALLVPFGALMSFLLFL